MLWLRRQERTVSCHVLKQRTYNLDSITIKIQKGVEKNLTRRSGFSPLGESTSIQFMKIPKSSVTEVPYFPECSWLSDILPSCHQTGVKFLGRSIPLERQLVQFVPNAEDCQLICKQIPSCGHFNYQTTTGTCDIFSSIIGEDADPGYVSGPKHCPCTSNRVL